MMFEKRMKKRGNAKLDKMAPNPYQHKNALPSWAKVAFPIAGVAMAAAIALAVIIPNLNGATIGPGPAKTESRKCFVAAPKETKVQKLEKSLVARTAMKTLESLDTYFADSNNTNYVLSPASYLLAASGLAAVSEGFDLNAFGLENAENDCKNLLKSWNFLYETKKEYESWAYCRFDSGILHQQVGGTYRFEQSKQNQVAEDYIATSVASLTDYHQQATDYFHNTVGLTIPVPDPRLTQDGVITYGALKMKDYIPGGLNCVEKDFHVGEKTIRVDSYSFGSSRWPLYLPYYAGENYQAFRKNVENTDLLLIVPNEGVSLESISICDTYTSFMKNKKIESMAGSIPYFHLRCEMEDLTKAMVARMDGNEKLYSKLLADDVINDLRVGGVLQTSDFEFNRYGVSGESITAIWETGSSMPAEQQIIELYIDRPFYAISLKDDFPLFVNKVNDPSK